jgi:3'-phosphoadenosine 5'-phosphosulfate sulfotransferase (PAPS reductase)/FAD synthetase
VTAPRTPDLASYDTILVSSSAGKDSQAMLDHVVGLCDAASIPRKRIVVVHADLGRMEWPGTRELAAEQAAHYGVRFEVVSRIGVVKSDDQGTTYRRGETFGDILDYASRRGMWPDAQSRWCTSEFKRGPIRKLITRLHREHGATCRYRVLCCMGMRAQESSKRKQFLPFVTGAAPGKKNTRDACTDLRHVDTWLPLHTWSTEDVWAAIRRSGVRHHPAYDTGMKRLSCRLCIFAPADVLMLAGSLAPDLLADYVAVETKTGHTFRKGFALRVIQERLAAGERPKGATSDDGCWDM